jgi:hypothetical protein
MALISIGSPPEFKGQPDIWAPEELLVGSVNACLMLTFLTLAQAKGLVPLGYQSEAEGLVQTLFATLRTDFGDCPRDELSVDAGEPLEGPQRVHDLATAHEIHFCNDGRFDRHFCNSKTAERIDATMVQRIPDMFLRNQRRRLGGANCIARTR